MNIHTKRYRSLYSYFFMFLFKQILQNRSGKILWMNICDVLGLIISVGIGSSMERGKLFAMKNPQHIADHWKGQSVIEWSEVFGFQLLLCTGLFTKVVTWIANMASLFWHLSYINDFNRDLLDDIHHESILPNEINWCYSIDTKPYIVFFVSFNHSSLL